jgi:hypothetical protein
MKSKSSKRSLSIWALAPISVVLLVTTVVIAYKAFVIQITGIGCLPQELDVRVVRGEDLQNAPAIHLTEKDFAQHPALDSATWGDNRDPGGRYSEGHTICVPNKRVIGSVLVTSVELFTLRDLGLIQWNTGMRSLCCTPDDRTALNGEEYFPPIPSVQREPGVPPLTN